MISMINEWHGGPKKVGLGTTNYWWYTNLKRSNMRLIGKC